MSRIDRCYATRSQTARRMQDIGTEVVLLHDRVKDNIRSSPRAKIKKAGIRTMGMLEFSRCRSADGKSKDNCCIRVHACRSASQGT